MTLTHHAVALRLRKLLYPAASFVGQFFVKYKSDIEKLAVDLQSAVGVVGQNLLGKNLTKLYAFLVKAVQIPCKALEHDLVLK